MSHKKHILSSLAVFLVVVVVIVLAIKSVHLSPFSIKFGGINIKNTPAKVKELPPQTTYSIDTPGSIWIIVNKTRPLPSNYRPTLVVPNIPLRASSSSEEMHVSSAMSGPLEQLVAGAKQSGILLELASGFRSYSFQKSLYNGYVASQGQASADRSSARPGYSEHQTGLAADVAPTSGKCMVDQCFGNLPEGIWLRDHAYEYGFIIRYPDGKEPITGYEYEPWHIRYVGTDLAKKIHDSSKTLEEYFNLPAAPTYK